MTETEVPIKSEEEPQPEVAPSATVVKSAPPAAKPPPAPVPKPAAPVVAKPTIVAKVPPPNPAAPVNRPIPPPNSNAMRPPSAPSNKSKKKKSPPIPMASSSQSGEKGVQGENVGRWTAEEHRLFLQGLEQHGKGWKKIASLIKTRSVVQIRYVISGGLCNSTACHFSYSGLPLEHTRKSTFKSFQKLAKMGKKGT